MPPLTLFKLLSIRSVGSHRLRTALSISGIILGVANILAIGITNLAAMDSVTRVFENISGRTSLMVVNAEQADKSVPESRLHIILGQPGVEMVVPIIQVQTELANEKPTDSVNLDFFGASNEGLALYGIDPDLDMKVRDYRLSGGRFLGNDLKASEIVLVRDYADEKELSLGERIGLLTPNGFHYFELVGLMEKEGAGNVNNGAFGVIPIGLSQSLFNRKEKIDRIDIVAGKGYESAEALDNLKVSIQKRLGPNYSVIYPSSQGKRMTQMLDSYQIGLNFMSGMALFVGAFLIYNAFSMTVVERTREFGMLRTIGMTQFQVIGLVLVEAVVLGLTGAGIGVIFGLGISMGLARMMEMMLGQTLLIKQVPMDIVITSISVGVITTLLAALLPALQAGRISPLEALRIRGQQQSNWLIRKGWLPGVVLLLFATVVLIWDPFAYDVQFRLGSLIVFALFTGAALLIPSTIGVWERFLNPVFQAIYGSSGRLGSSNVQREKLRTTLTVGALMIGVAMAVVTLGLTESFKGDLVNWINAYLGGDLYISSKANLTANFSRRLETVEGVDAAASVNYFEVKMHKPDGSDEPITMMSVDPQEYTRVTKFVFSDSQIDQKAALASLAGGDAVFVSSVISEKYNLETGSTIRLRTSVGLRDFKVAAVVVDFYNQGLVLTGSSTDMRRYFRISDIYATLVKLDVGRTVEEVQARIKDLYDKRYNLSIISNQAIKESVNRLMKQAFSMFDVLAQIAIIIASLGVVNTLTMNVMERLKEIGMLRSIGMTRLQVALMILAEAGMMSLVGGALGLVFGILLARLFLTSMMSMSGYQLTYTMPASRVLISLAAVIIISQVAAILPAIRAGRAVILEAIHYE